MSFYTTVEERRFSAASDDFSYGFSPGATTNATTGAEAHLHLIRNAALEGPLFHGGANIETGPPFHVIGVQCRSALTADS